MELFLKQMRTFVVFYSWFIGIFFGKEGIGELETRFSGVKDFDKNNTAYKIIITFGRDGIFQSN